MVLARLHAAGRQLCPAESAPPAGFAGLAVVTLGAAIGVNTTLFTVFDAVFLRPWPVADASRVFEVTIAHDDLRPRMEEFSIGESLGAGRSRLLRQLLTENLILATLAALPGLAVAFIVPPYFVDWIYGQFGGLGTRPFSVTPDLTVVAWTAGLVVLTWDRSGSGCPARAAIGSTKSPRSHLNTSKSFAFPWSPDDRSLAEIVPGCRGRQSDPGRGVLADPPGRRQDDHHRQHPV